MLTSSFVNVSGCMRDGLSPARVSIIAGALGSEGSKGPATEPHLGGQIHLWLSEIEGKHSTMLLLSPGILTWFSFVWFLKILICVKLFYCIKIYFVQVQICRNIYVTRFDCATDILHTQLEVFGKFTWIRVFFLPPVSPPVFCPIDLWGDVLWCYSLPRSPWRGGKSTWMEVSICFFFQRGWRVWSRVNQTSVPVNDGRVSQTLFKECVISAAPVAHWRNMDNWKKKQCMATVDVHMFGNNFWNLVCCWCQIRLHSKLERYHSCK